MATSSISLCARNNGRVDFYGGREFKTKQEVIDAMSDRDWRRIVKWESRHAARIAGQAVKQA